MADWHPEFRQFVPRSLTLTYAEALGVMNGLHIFIASLERGRPSTKTERLTQRSHKKYHGKRNTFIFDRELRDNYTMIFDDRGLTLVTVTELSEDHALCILDDLRPPCRFSDVDEIELPYALHCVLHDDPEFQSIRTPSGREIKLTYCPKFPLFPNQTVESLSTRRMHYEKE